MGESTWTKRDKATGKFVDQKKAPAKEVQGSRPREVGRLKPERTRPDLTNLLKIPTWVDDQSIYVVIETPRGSRCKLNYDPQLRVFTLAKPLMVGLTYPYDWGFIPST